MRKSIVLMALMLSVAATAGAQTFLNQLQKKVQGQGTVTVSQSKEIDDLVNGKQPVATQSQKNTTPVTKPGEHPGPTAATTQHNGDSTKKESTHHEPVVPHKDTTDKDDNEMEIPTVDLRKKVMTQSYKVDGYRVQAFSGGNSRADRVRAREIGNAIKMTYPNEPVYVHFYSPRWICRVGNYRSIQEATAMLHNIQKMGYKQATIVRGKITIQY